MTHPNETQNVSDYHPMTLLEVGAGLNTFFDEQTGSECEYWMVDDAGFYPDDRFSNAMQKRRNTRFVSGLLGANLPELPNNHFDLVFSISVLEHVPPSQRLAIYQEMYRVVRPGGHIVHSIDGGREYDARQHFEALRSAGFFVPSSPDLSIRVHVEDGPSTLFEPVCIVFRTYFGKGRPDMWTDLRSIRGHSPTALVVGTKPAAQASA